jgi:hypothetical protein
MAAAVTNLKRLMAVCSERRIFIITPGLHATHCVSSPQIPDIGFQTPVDDLKRLHIFLYTEAEFNPQLHGGSCWGFDCLEAQTLAILTSSPPEPTGAQSMAPGHHTPGLPCI